MKLALLLVVQVQSLYPFLLLTLLPTPSFLGAIREKTRVHKTNLQAFISSSLKPWLADSAAEEEAAINFAIRRKGRRTWTVHV